MTVPLLCRTNLDFLLHDWLGASDDDAGFEIVHDIMNLSEKLATDAFLTHYKRSDVEEPSLVDGRVVVCPGIAEALGRYGELGLFSAGFPEELGGLGLSHLVCTASFAFFAAANIATSGYPMLTVANARLIATFGSAAQIEQFAKPQIAGRWFGTMCLSEPQAGSALGDIRTRAVADGEDELGPRYRLSGNKMWISCGDHELTENIVHLVLAKIPDVTGALPQGTAGISLFIVPKRLPDGSANDIAVAGLNHKMGYRGTVNCLLNFGERDGAVGWLVGAPGQGLRQMFQMMNEARIGVAVGAAALGYRSHMLSLAYARERLQGRAEGSDEPVPIVRHPDVRRMLLQQRVWAEGALALCLYGAALVDQEDAGSAALLALLTPVIKTWSSEQGLGANDLAIQIHGGYGYTRDFDVEQLWRDNRLNPIHEGTTGVQALDLLGRKILRGGDGLSVLEARMRATIAKAEDHDGLAALGRQLEEAWLQIGTAIEALRRQPTETAHGHATLFLRAFGHLVVAWLWLDQTVAALASGTSGRRGDRFVDGKLQSCRFFFRQDLPLLSAWTRIITDDDAPATGIREDLL
jgi:alkylation response protein AidB-like acyl-CoA dehydrogenase